jgi:NAD(P)H-dependent flavin oxidoreductase YrpB (nitropropane dioxygenase family)
MGPVCSNELCAAVSEAGGLGMIKVAWTAPELLEMRLDHIRSLTSKPIGANFLIPITDRDCFRVASRAVRVIDFFWGDPDPQLVDIAHGGGALASWQVGSTTEALAADQADRWPRRGDVLLRGPVGWRRTRRPIRGRNRLRADGKI